jgi:hypothetical protein
VGPAPPIVGVHPDGTPVRVELGAGRHLVAFLTTGCATCGWWWANVGTPPAGLPPLAAIVTPEPAMESPKDVAAVAPDGAPVVMAGDAWEEFGVGQSATFVLVDKGRVSGRVTAASWADVETLAAIGSRP